MTAIEQRVCYHYADLIVRVSGDYRDIPARLSPMMRGINLWLKDQRARQG